MNIFGGFDFGIASPISGISSSGGVSSGGIAYTEPMVDYYWPNNDIATVSPISISGPSGYEPGVATAEPATKVQPDTPSEHAPQGGGITIALPGFDEGGTPHWEEHKVEPGNAEPAKGIDIALPGFDDNGTPHWEEHKVPTENAEPVEKKLDVEKLLGYHNEGYKLYSDGEGGVTLDPYTKDKVYDPTKIQDYTGQTARDAEKKAAQNATLPEVSGIYKREGDDYSVDNKSKDYVDATNNQIAASISGSRGNANRNNSNVNDAIFGGESNKATPGYSLW